MTSRERGTSMRVGSMKLTGTFARTLMAVLLKVERRLVRRSRRISIYPFSCVEIVFPSSDGVKEVSEMKTTHLSSRKRAKE